MHFPAEPKAKSYYIQLSRDEAKERTAEIEAIVWEQPKEEVFGLGRGAYWENDGYGVIVVCTENVAQKIADAFPDLQVMEENEKRVEPAQTTHADRVRASQQPEKKKGVEWLNRTSSHGPCYG